MALRRTLAQRLYKVTKISTPSNTLSHSPFSSPSSEQPLIPPDPAKDGFFRRFIHKRTIIQSLPLGEKLKEILNGMNSSGGDRLRLDGLNPPPATTSAVTPKQISISVEDTTNLLRLLRLKMLRTKLRSIPKNCISYSNFVHICSDGCSSPDQGLEYAKTLEESGAVIVFGNIVFLRPDQVAKVEEAIISLSMDDLRREELEQMEKEKIAIGQKAREELEEMEKEKIEIDQKANDLVGREICIVLGFVVMQIAASMRLTFWELSWDVMEPICFHVTAIYFLARLTFFFRTSKEPSFQRFYETRFLAKQKRLMKNKKFDIKRFDELRRGCSSFSSATPGFNLRSIIQEIEYSSLIR
ncbi:calcium uniporter protein 3, mitochondrial-like [Telopea speciosissima]|uniref:calcium uniporter protein 3, mitochondrial-like n=1 Tax=Telopea speciosissima TaxID=54955 RepID=UPI001CC79C58|nr:calcium uniporter protein 3, mitochondrial-like [Telopea speciosissima]